nr:immunoglobulin heavy chain junction region [Mus musculus]
CARTNYGSTWFAYW